MSPTGEYDRGTDRPHCGEQTVNTLRVGPQDAVTGAQHSDKTDVLPVEPHFMAGRAWPTFSTDTELGLCSIYSHCDSVFQQSDQLSETVSALVPSLKHAVIHSPCRSVRSVSRKDRPEKSCFPSLSRVHIFPCGCKFSHVGASFPMWVQVFSCGCEFSLVGASFSTCTSPTRRQDEISSPQRQVGASFLLWVRVFQLALPRHDDKMEILSPQRHVGASFLLWVRVFQLALPRQDEILSPQREVGASFPMWVRVFSCGCEFSNLHFPDTMTRWKSCRHKDIPAEKPGIENAASRRNRTVSPDGVHPTRAGNTPQILLRKLFQRAF